MTLAEAAERSACSPKTIRRAIDAGQLTSIRLGSSAKSDRIHPTDLDDWWGRSRHIPISALTLPRGSRPCPHMPTADERLAVLLNPKVPSSRIKDSSSLQRKQRRGQLRKGTERQ